MAAVEVAFAVVNFAVVKGTLRNNIFELQIKINFLKFDKSYEGFV